GQCGAGLVLRLPGRYRHGPAQRGAIGVITVLTFALAPVTVLRSQDGPGRQVMPFFGMPYRVLFHDTMAYGTHHFLTNLKFQCEAGEHFFWGGVVEGSAEGKAVHDDVVILTQQAYCRNLAPVRVGEWVGILLSVEDATASSVRMCFRVVRHDATPVSCGFQSL